MRFVIVVCLCAGALAGAGCGDGRGIPTSPNAVAAVSGVVSSLSASPRSGDLHVTKECGEYNGAAGDFCTITSSNVKAIEVGSKVFYKEAAGATSLDSDVVLDAPGPGNNKAFGHCAVSLVSGLGVCTFSGGTGKFMGFSAIANVTPPTSDDPENWHWDGTYSFRPQD